MMCVTYELFKLSAMLNAKIDVQGSYLQHFNFSVIYEWPNKLGCYIMLVWNGLPGTNTQAYWVPL